MLFILNKELYVLEFDKYVILYVYFNEEICKYVCMLDGFNNFKRDVNVRGIVLFYD